MVVTRSQSGDERRASENRGTPATGLETMEVGTNPTAAPSNDDATIQPNIGQVRSLIHNVPFESSSVHDVMAATTTTALHTLPTRSSLLTGHTAQIQPRLSPAQSVVSNRTGHSTSSAMRIRRLELETAERLSEIRQQQLELQAENLQRRLQFKIAEIENEGSLADPEENKSRVDQWLRSVTPAVESRPEGHLHSREEPVSRITPTTAVPIATAPHYDRREGNPSHIAEHRESLHHYEQRDAVQVQSPDHRVHRSLLPTQRDEQRDNGSDYQTPAPVREQPPTYRYRRQSHSPNETRHRSPSRHRGIEQLAAAIEKIAKNRPMPRQATDLPVFNGSVNEWMPFQAAWRDSSTIYNFTRAENMARLRNCLRGEARQAVAALLHTATDPEVVMKTLQQCFGQPEVIVHQTMEELRRLPRPGNNASDLNQLAVRLQNIVKVLENIDQRGYLYNPMLKQEVIEKLSPHLRSRWCDFAEENSSVDEPTIVTLSRFLTQEADRALRHAFTSAGSLASTSGTSATSRTKNDKPSQRTKVHKSQVYNATEKKTDVKKQRQCICCGDQHAVSTCRKLRDMTVNERWDWAKNARLCFKCIDNQHRRTICRAPRCSINGCNRPHHPLLHAEESRPEQEVEISERSGNTTDESEAVMSIANENRTVLLKVCSVIVCGPAGEVTTHALLDEGSTVTLIDEKIADIIGAVGHAAPLSLQGVNASKEQDGSRRIDITIRGRHERTAHKITARTIRDLKLRQQSVPRDLTQRYAHLQGLEMTCTEDARPQILIGADHWHLMVSHQLRTGKRNEPAASRTDLGWVIYGSVPYVLHRNKNDTVLHLQEVYRKPCTNDGDERLHEMVKEHFAIDALGVSLRTKVKPDDQRSVDIFNKTARRVDNQFEVGLPWRTDDVVLPPNYSDAFTRLRGIEKKMDRDPKFKETYKQQIQNLIEKGYASKCDGSERDSKREWFLPHFAVHNPNKPGKIRLVFDAAHKSQGVSLNDHLLMGPDLLRSLPGILFRFREQPIAVTADIAEMFLRIKIRIQDQASQKFLWRGDNRTKPPTHYKMTSMIFGAASSPFLAHSVRNRNALDHATTHPRALEVITNSHYMDDLVHSFATTEDAKRTVKEVIEVHSRANFTLRGWNSNCPRLLSIIPEPLRAREPTALVSSEDQSYKTLGILWDAINDELGFNTTLARVPEAIRTRQRSPTKREALAVVMSIFDPLGLLSCHVITVKILLQDLWRIQLPWDDTLPQEYASRFDRWMETVNDVSHLRLARRYNPNDDNNEVQRQLHIFTDASEQAYAAAAYWRLQHRDGKITVVLAAGKAKVAPLRPQTIPRLELQAAVIGARLADMVIREHRWKADSVTYWSDSRTVLQWIRTDARRYTPYVAHRLGEIAELTDSRQWRWVPTAENVADDATRGECHTPGHHERWFTGPTFLYGPEDSWPREQANYIAEETEEVHHTTTNEDHGALPDIRRFSSFERLIRTTATVIAFIEKCKKKATQLELRHIERAEKLWIARAQSDDFSEEIVRLQAGRPLPANSRLAKLDPMIEDGELRVRGRINAARAPTNTKRPLILNGRHPLTRLIVLRQHAASGHASNERVVNDLRQRYWILRARPTVRSIARTCTLCQLRKAMPRIPPMGDLPPARLDPYCRPFTNCGVDYFGPMMVVIGRRREKRWGALFTCLTTRAVHIEIVTSLSIDSAIMALRRMAARRGWPRQMWSDNGTNFRGADTELRAAYAEWAPALRDYAQLQRMDWRFIPPGAPNQGGAWERLVRSIKNALQATLKEQAPKEEVLHTLLIEAEHAVNGRPLTHVTMDPTDPEALTPNHFLIGTSSGLPQTGPCDLADRRTWRAAQGMADQFWRRWIHEYLPTLVPRLGSQDRRRPVKKGDLVLVVDPKMPRNVWPRGIVQRVHTGPDGDVRSAEVKTIGGVFTRPTRKLVVLPVQEAASSNGRSREEDVADDIVLERK